MRGAGQLLGVLCVVAYIVVLGGCGGTTGPGTSTGTSVGTAGKPPPPPTTSMIAFVRQERNANYGIWVMYTNGTGATKLTSTGTSNSSNYPSWSADGRICFASRRDGTPHIYTMNRDGSAQTRITSEPNVSDLWPDWSRTQDPSSPGYGRIAFERVGQAGWGWGFNTPTQGIYVVDANGGAAQFVTGTQPNDRHPSWSPDGRFIVFTGGSRTPQGFYVIPAGGATASLLVESSRVQDFFRWSPQGDQIADSWGGVTPVSQVNGQWVAGTRRSLPQPAGTNLQARGWSPDEQYLACQAVVNGDTAGATIRTVKVADGTYTGLAQGYCPDWSPILP